MTEPWTSVPLDEAVALITEPFAPSHGTPDDLLVGVGDLDELGELTEPRRSLEDTDRLDHLRRFAPGDLLFATTRRTGAKVWLADAHGHCTTSFAVLRPTGRLDQRYLLWYLRAPRAARLTMRRADLARHAVPVPPAPHDMAAIVSTLDAVSTSIRLRRHALALTRQLGPSRYQERFGDPLAQRGPWPAVRLGAVVELLEMGWSPKCAHDPARGDEWGVLKVSAVSSGTFLAEENKALLPDTTPREHLGLHAGDLLMVRSNTSELVGATAIVERDHPRLLFNDKLWRLRIAEGVSPRFLKGVLSHPAVRARLSELARGSLASMQNLTKERVLDLPLAWPPTAARSDYVQDLAAIDDTIQTQMAQAAQLEELLQVLLGEAFEAQGPEPLDDIIIERPLLHELSELQRGVWKVLAAADDPLAMPELSRRIERHLPTTHGVDQLRRALNVLTAAGVAIQREVGTDSYRWETAQHDSELVRR